MNIDSFFDHHLIDHHREGDFNKYPKKSSPPRPPSLRMEICRDNLPSRPLHYLTKMADGFKQDGAGKGDHGPYSKYFLCNQNGFFPNIIPPFAAHHMAKLCTTPSYPALYYGPYPNYAANSFYNYALNRNFHYYHYVSKMAPSTTYCPYPVPSNLTSSATNFAPIRMANGTETSKCINTTDVRVRKTYRKINYKKCPTKQVSKKSLDRDDNPKLKMFGKDIKFSIESLLGLNVSASSNCAKTRSRKNSKVKTTFPRPIVKNEPKFDYEEKVNIHNTESINRESLTTPNRVIDKEIGDTSSDHSEKIINPNQRITSCQLDLSFNLSKLIQIVDRKGPIPTNKSSCEEGDVVHTRRINKTDHKIKKITRNRTPKLNKFGTNGAEVPKLTNRHLCVFCGKYYSRRYGLKIHLRTHTGYKPLKCNFCERTFGDPSNLNKHIRLHMASTEINKSII